MSTDGVTVDMRDIGYTSAKKQMCAVFDELLSHSGYGEMQITTRWMKAGRKEVIIRSGKEHRFVIRLLDQQN